MPNEANRGARETGDQGTRSPEPQTAAESVEMGDRFRRRGDLESAVRYYRRAVQQDSDSPLPRMRLAEAYESQELNAKAAEQYEKLLKQNDAFAEAHVGLADVYRRFGKHKAAILRLRRACELEPDNAYYWFRLAEACAKAGRKREAIEPATRAALTDPDDAFYHAWLGDLLLSLGQITDAITAFEAATRLDADDAGLQVRLAAALCAIERFEDARLPIERACTLQPGNALYHAIRCDVLAMCGDEAPPTPILDAYDRCELRRWRDLAGL